MAIRDVIGSGESGLGRLLGRGVGGSDRWGSVRGIGETALNRKRAEARLERRRIDRFLQESDAAQRTSRGQLAEMPLPEGTDWRWRPPLLNAPLDPTGRVGPGNAEGLGDSAKVFHDCSEAAMVLRQLPNRDATDLSRYSLSLEVMGFTGNFLSLALPLPPEALVGLDRGHVVRLDTHIEIERPVELFARLNIVSGPNADRLQSHLGWMQPGRANHHSPAFDLAETEINPDRLESAWIDLIIDAPMMNRVVLRDMVVSRHRRADI